ncbi:hypothetical protein BB558_002557 [Smittium angustum]|uniref:Uncharacterized protein n=1 Tax=Smittium angustum TaxID=133377 RepID=A0A2U1J8C0_SMIAN|nr:hypothetical protein BB558_002557 [Smittium angustum]
MTKKKSIDSKEFDTTEIEKKMRAMTDREFDNPFDELDEYTLETIFILSGNPEISTLSIKLFKVAHYIPTQVKYLKRNIYARPEFAQSVFYSRHPKFAKKEELVIKLLKQGININSGDGNSIYNRVFKYKMIKALFAMIKSFKLEKVAYTPGSENKIEPHIFRNNEYYIVKPLMDGIDEDKILKDFELYKDENIETLLKLYEANSYMHDLVEDCGIPAKNLFQKKNRILNLYQNVELLQYQDLLRMAIIHNQPRITKCALEFSEFTNKELKEVLEIVEGNDSYYNDVYRMATYYINPDPLLKVKDD